MAETNDINARLQITADKMRAATLTPGITEADRLMRIAQADHHAMLARDIPLDRAFIAQCVVGIEEDAEREGKAAMLARVRAREIHTKTVLNPLINAWLAEHGSPPLEENHA